MRYAMVIDLRKCTGCNACTAACKIANTTPPGIFWSKVINYETGDYPKVHLRFLPMLCMQCQEAPCLEACPTGATYRGEAGLVLVNDNLCIGCRYCIMACPYEARSYNYSRPGQYFSGKGLTMFEQSGYRQHPKASIEKCNFCAPRVLQGRQPACVSTCPPGARTFGDLDDPNSQVSLLIRERYSIQLHPEIGTKPSVYYIP